MPNVVYASIDPVGFHAGLPRFGSVGTVISAAPSLSTIRMLLPAHIRNARRGDAALARHPALDLVRHAMHGQSPIATEARCRQRELADVDDLPAADVVQRDVKPVGHRGDLHDGRRVEPREHG